MGMEGHRKGAEGAEAVQRAQRGHGWHVEEALGHREGAEGYRGSLQGYGGGMDRVQKGCNTATNLTSADLLHTKGRRAECEILSLLDIFLS